MKDVSIDYSKGKFLVQTPPQLASVARMIPNRRWDGRNRIWRANNIRGNREYLKRVFQRYNFTDLAWEEVNAIIERKPLKDFPHSYEFKGTPYKHQLDALNKINSLDAYALFMEQGLGKSFTTINDLCNRYNNNLIDAVLVVCPMSIRGNWQREVEKFATVPSLALPLVTKSAKKDLDQLWDFDGLKWYIVAVESLSSGKAPEIAEKFLLHTRPAMVVDESSTIKNHKANRTKTTISLGKMAKVRAILTGTPVANGLHDLFSQFEFIDSEIIGLGDFYSFRNRYCIMGGYENRQVIGYTNTEELMELIAENTFQATKAEALDLPDKIYQRREIEPSPDQKDLFRAIKQQLIAEVDGDRVKIDNILEKLLRLQQITAGFFTDEEGDMKMLSSAPKIKELMQVIDETGGQVIIWCVFRKEIEMVAEALSKVGTVVEFHGGVSEEQRNENIKLFQEGKARFFIANPAAGGMGITLTAANTVIYMSNSFSYTDRAQSEDRAHRIGQEKHVTYIDIVMKGSVDELVQKALHSKQDVAGYVRDNISTLTA
jgi:SNF2 family DNA or RNA helicase